MALHASVGSVRIETVRASLPKSAQDIAIVIGDSHDKASLTFRHMTDLTRKQPVANLDVTETDLKTGADKDKLKQFVGTITYITDLVSRTKADTLRKPPQG